MIFTPRSLDGECEIWLSLWKRSGPLDDAAILVTDLGYAAVDNSHQGLPKFMNVISRYN